MHFSFYKFWTLWGVPLFQTIHVTIEKKFKAVEERVIGRAANKARRGEVRLVPMCVWFVCTLCLLSFLSRATAAEKEKGNGEIGKPEVKQLPACIRRGCIGLKSHYGVTAARRTTGNTRRPCVYVASFSWRGVNPRIAAVDCPTRCR